MKIWYIICIWLCYFSISNLLKENSEIIHKSSDQTESTNYLVCFNLKEIDTLTNNTTVDLQELEKIVCSYVSNRFNKFEGWKKEDFINFKKFVLNLIEPRDYLYF